MPNYKFISILIWFVNLIYSLIELDFVFFYVQGTVADGPWDGIYTGAHFFLYIFFSYRVTGCPGNRYPIIIDNADYRKLPPDGQSFLLVVRFRLLALFFFTPNFGTSDLPPDRLPEYRRKSTKTVKQCFNCFPYLVLRVRTWCSKSKREIQDF